MADVLEVKRQLRQIGEDKSLFCMAERRELPKILFDGEQIHHVVNGNYSGGMAMLCATDRRVLLVDKKPFYLMIEDVKYDMIADVMYNDRMLKSSIIIGTFHKSITFKSWWQAEIRSLTSFVQQKITEARSSQQAVAAVVDKAVQVGSFGVPIKKPSPTLRIPQAQN